MLEVRMFGKFTVSSDGEPIRVASEPARLLLAYLVLNVGNDVRRDKLAGLIWPNADESSARKNLRQALWRLRKAIGESYIQASHSAIRFQLAPPDRVDVVQLKDRIPDEPSVEELERTLDSYGGELLPGFYEEWIVRERDRFRAIFEERVERLLELLSESEEWSKLRDWSEKWIALETAAEPAYRALMRAHANLGDRAAAAEVYRRCVEDLRANVGVDPSQETQALYRELVDSDQESVPSSSPALDTSWSYVLPLPASPFVGRKDELADLARRLSDGKSRLISVIGPGGVGKTRLALHSAAGRLDAFLHGVHFVPLAQARSVEGVILALADSLGLNLLEPAAPRDLVLDYLREREVLLILDNFETVMEGVGLIEEILVACPSVTALVTSREVLGLEREEVVRLSGLELGSEPNGSPEDSDAVRMFVTYAQRSSLARRPQAREIEQIREICRAVAGSPLAIELAASWAAVMTAQEIVDRLHESLDILRRDLRNIPERQRSMRAVLDQSWDLLSESERNLLGSLAVFEGGFSAGAARKVTGADPELLSALVDKSLLQPDRGGRYSFHELIHRYLRDRQEALEARPDTARAHAIYYLDFLLKQFRTIQGPQVQRGFKEMEAELANISAAWQFIWDGGRFEELLSEGLEQGSADVWKVLTSLYQFSISRNLRSFGRQMLSLVVDTVEPVDHHLEGHVLANALTLLSGFLPSPEEELEATLRAWDLVKEYPAEGQMALMQLTLMSGRVPTDIDPEDARIRIDQAVESGRNGGDPWLHGLLVGAAGHVLMFGLNEPRRGRLLMEEAREVLDGMGEHYMNRILVAALGQMALIAGQFEEAADLYGEGLDIARQLDAEGLKVNMAIGLGRVHMYRGNHEQARQTFLESLAATLELGSTTRAHEIYCYLSQTAAYGGDPVSAEHYLESAKASQDGSTSVRLMESQAIVLHAGKEYERAEAVLEEAIKLADGPERLLEMAALWGTLAEIRLGAGDFHGAFEAARTSLDIAAGFGAVLIAGNSICTLAEIASELGEVELAAELAAVTARQLSGPVSRDAMRAEKVLDRIGRALPQDKLEQAVLRGEGAALTEVSAWLDRPGFDVIRSG